MKKKILFVVSLLFGLLFITMGLNKFLNFIPAPPDLPEEIQKAMEAFMTLKWLMPLIGLGEIVGGALFIFNKTRALGAIVIFPIIVGIVLHHLTFAPDQMVLAIVVLAINLWVIYENREKYMHMIR